jgi:hypothetical protein
MSLSAISNMLATWTGIVAAVVGGAIGLDSYREDVQKRVDERQLAAFAQVQAFLSRDMVPIREKVQAYVKARRSCDSQPWQSFGLSEAELSSYVEMLDLAEACRAADLCDAGTIERFFAPYARSGLPVLMPFIEAVREGNKALRLEVPFGAGMERLAREGSEGLGCGS